MAKFQFRLGTLLRLREAARDECRAHLAEALRAEEVLRQREVELNEIIEGLRIQLSQESRAGKIDVEKLINNHRYGALLEAERALLNQQGQQVAGEIEKRRLALVSADREVHVLEKLREKQERLHRENEEKLEIKVLDEIAGRCRAMERNL